MDKIKEALEQYGKDLVEKETTKLTEIIIAKIQDKQFQEELATKINKGVNLWGLNEEQEQKLILWVIDLLDDHLVNLLEGFKGKK